MVQLRKHPVTDMEQRMKKFIAFVLLASVAVVCVAATFPWTRSGAYDFNTPVTITPLSAGTTLDFSSENRTAVCTLTGAVTFAYSGLTGTNVLTFNIQIQNSQSTNCAFAFPTGTAQMGILGYQTAGKRGRLTFEYWPGLSTNVMYIEQQ